jgi:catechol 2,3-dioxygenase-like lactoylglutathione lyase family enzyme
MIAAGRSDQISGEAMLNLQKVVHFTIPVKELQRSEDFYCNLLGLERVRRTGHMVFLNCHGASFVLTLSENPIDPNKGDKHEIHTAFLVSAEDYDRAKVLLAEKGVRVFKEEDRRSGTFHGRSAYFHDPDRNVIEIIDLVRGPVNDKDELVA